jgi:hypothetical protein
MVFYRRAGHEEAMDPVRGVLMDINVITHVSKSCGQSKFKKGATRLLVAL